jgi:hypothetical protein
MATYIIALGTFAGQLTASLRRDHAASPAVLTDRPQRSFLGALLGALAAWPC